MAPRSRDVVDRWLARPQVRRGDLTRRRSAVVPRAHGPSTRADLLEHWYSEPVIAPGPKASHAPATRVARSRTPAVESRFVSDTAAIISVAASATVAIVVALITGLSQARLARQERARSRAQGLREILDKALDPLFQASIRYISSYERRRQTQSDHNDSFLPCRLISILRKLYARRMTSASTCGFGKSDSRPLGGRASDRGEIRVVRCSSFVGPVRQLPVAAILLKQNMRGTPGTMYSRRKKLSGKLQRESSVLKKNTSHFLG